MKRYQSMKIGIASPEEILTWSNPYLRDKQFVYKYYPQASKSPSKTNATVLDLNGNPILDENGNIYQLRGEVTSMDTVNYRTSKPEKGGLFCEVIFGPTKDYTCGCGKTPHSKSKEGNTLVCEKCGVEFTSSKVRRERMGFIALGSPVVHSWYLRNTPSKIALLLKEKSKDIEEIVYSSKYYITDVYNDEIISDDLKAGLIITEQKKFSYDRQYPGQFRAITGAQAIKELLQKVDLEAKMKEIRNDLKTATKQEKEKAIKRLEIVEAFYNSEDNKPEWMVMDVVPVIPPDLRPMVQLEGGVFATTDLNELYHKILTRNESLKKFYNLPYSAPEILIKNQKRLLQEAVDSLIDNSKHSRKVALVKNRPLKSLSDILRGKQGRFRQNLLGKRVDYSGRSVICVGPFLKMYQCGIPREMALTLFKPFIINYLCKKEEADANLDTLLLNPNDHDKSIRNAKSKIENATPEAMDALEHIIVEHPVLLNRAPTLHRLSIQAFEPVLVEGRAIRLHPLATTAFNADFDGDQMPVHVPLSIEAQTEARMLMLASKNILAPKDGKPVVTPSQDMIIGNYYITIERSEPDRMFDTFESLYDAYKSRVFEFNNKIIVNGDEDNYYENIEALRQDILKGTAPSVGKFFVPGREGKAFKDISEVEHAYEENEIDFHTRFVIPARAIGKPFVNFDPSNPDYAEKMALNETYMNMYLVTTYGKITFNQVFPENFIYFANPDITDKSDGKDNLKNATPERFFLAPGTNFKEAIANMPLTKPVNKKTLSAIISEIFNQCKLAETSLTLDKMKDLGFYYSTISGLTISAFDIKVLEQKYDIIKEADLKVEQYNKLYRRGLMLDSERKEKVVNIWKTTKESIASIIEKKMKDEATVNDIFLMADSGARGSKDNFTQLAGMRGLMNKPNGEDMEIPVKSSFSEGMSMADFFNSTHGARKGSTDTALKTAQSGYLTRRLVDVSQDITITMDDCGTDKGVVMTTLYKTDEKTNSPSVLVKLYDRIEGRFAAKPVYAKIDGKKKLLVARNEIITEEIANQIVNAGIEEVEVRSNLTCNCPNGVCVKCYGYDLSTKGIVERGEVVGIVAAQSIGEPGTQLTMRTFHSGGVAGGGEDITQGLPRVEELFEASPPKGQGIISKVAGTVSITEENSRYTITVKSPIPNNDYVETTDYGKRPCVKDGDVVKPGDVLCEGALDVKELLKYSNVDRVEKYIVKEVQFAYRTAAGIEISDKHLEIIVKQMLQKVIVIDSGGTTLLPGKYISRSELYKVVKECWIKGYKIPVVKPVILGITRASLKKDSFLAAASFQETTRVLTEAAIRGKTDELTGLKENIIIGGLIPAGTGLIEDVKYGHIEDAPVYDIKKI